MPARESKEEQSPGQFERASSICYSAKEKDPEKTASKEKAKYAVDDQELIRWQVECRRQRRRMRACRMAVVFSGICIVVSSVLMAILGVNNLSKAMKDVIQLLQQVELLSEQGVVLIDNVTLVVGSVENHTSNLKDNSPIFQLLSSTDGQICGNITIEQVCDIWANENGVTSAQQCIDEWGSIQADLRSEFEELSVMEIGRAHV